MTRADQIINVKDAMNVSKCSFLCRFYKIFNLQQAVQLPRKYSQLNGRDWTVAGGSSIFAFLSWWWTFNLGFLLAPK